MNLLSLKKNSLYYAAVLSLIGFITMSTQKAQAEEIVVDWSRVTSYAINYACNIVSSPTGEYAAGYTDGVYTWYITGIVTCDDGRVGTYYQVKQFYPDFSVKSFTHTDSLENIRSYGYAAPVQAPAPAPTPAPKSPSKPKIYR